MPIALFPQLTAILSRTGKVLSPWSRMVVLEERILLRARGAFLVHWFGTSIPVQGLQLHIAIANIEALKRRYLEVERSMPGEVPELNLLGPLAGIAGFLFGAAISPTGAILIASQIPKITEHFVGGVGGGILAMLYRVLGIWILPALGTALGVLALPLLLTGALVSALSGDPLTRGLHRALGELALLLDAVIRFWDQVTGPRSEVQNPLLRRILEVFDRMAGLFVQIIGFAALLVTRFARLLPSVMNQFRAFVGLAGAVVDALTDLFKDFKDRITEPFTQGPGIVSILEGVFDSILELPEQMMERVGELVDDAITDLSQAFSAIAEMVRTFISGLQALITDAFRETAVGQLVTRIQNLLGMIPSLTEAFSHASGSSASGDESDGSSWAGRNLGDPLLYTITGGFLGSMWGLSDGSLTGLLGAIGEVEVPDFPELEMPGFPTSPALPVLDEILSRFGDNAGEDPTALSRRLAEEAEAAIPLRTDASEILRDPVSAFALEVRDLERTMGRPRLLLDDERLRDLIYLAVGRVLPPALRVYAPAVREGFDTLDERVYSIEREPLAHPMLDLTDNGRLRPIVEVMTVRSEGGFAPDIRAFRDLLVEEVERRTYLAPSVL